MLPEDVVSAILSLTSPLDVCAFSLVSSTFRSAAEFDVIWERFLPSDYQQLLSRLDLPLKFSTKKELFFHLCNSALIDGGRKSFRIEKSSGRKSYLLSARELSITWGSDPMHWSWKKMAESRFPEAVELITISWLEIHGKITTQMLSKNSKYGAYLVMNISRRAYGLDTIPSEVSVKVRDRVSNGMAYICRQDIKKLKMDSYCMQREQFPNEREDGWMEIKLGEFFTGEDDEEVKMSLMEIKGYQLKGGLVIEGIEVRPI
ncbi:hypothetical protein FEM48_Zijuj02G0135300 [Ziziphus jujuba var. spinosa]|uniref:F-box domain-containing protein n=1 Tax=Ziziphus jujuba var. spinosa TaxID=714518 RepID=A0A978VW03_ZIZJJ|nr:hypothetical protein FEM48_Zijuj02G0135300 [Ziziphus jujuba var. spinosa]